MKSPQLSAYSMVKKNENFLTKTWNKGWIPFLSLLVNMVLEVLDKQLDKKEKKRWHSNWKGRCKIISDCGWHNFIYRKQNAALHTLFRNKKQI